jgi:hypothetical protein
MCHVADETTKSNWTNCKLVLTLLLSLSRVLYRSSRVSIVPCTAYDVVQKARDDILHRSYVTINVTISVFLRPRSHTLAVPKIEFEC